MRVVFWGVLIVLVVTVIDYRDAQINAVGLMNSYRHAFDDDNYKLDDWQIMCLAIAATETWNTYDPESKNSTSSASGIMQQLDIIVRDCNRIVGYEKYRLDDRYSAVKAVEMFEIIQYNYNKEKDISKAIRLHSSGFGPENKEYAQIVLKNIENIENFENFREIILNYGK